MIINAIFTIIMLVLAAIDIKTTRTPEHKDFKAIIMTTGVLGTFVGVFLGLLNFDINDIEKSIPFLLDGLKVAFYTSIAGMSITILISIYQRLIGLKIDRKDDLDYIALQAQKLDNLEAINKSQSEMLELFYEMIKKTESNGSFLKDFEKNLTGELDSKFGAMERVISENCEINKSELSELKNIAQHAESVNLELRQMKENMNEKLEKFFADILSSIARNADRILESSASIRGMLNEINNNANALNQSVNLKADKISENISTRVSEINETLNLAQEKLGACFVEQIKDAIFALNKEISKLSTEFSSDVICGVDNLSKEFIRTIDSHFSENFKRFNSGVDSMIALQGDSKKLSADSVKLLNNTTKSLQKIENIANSIISRDEKTLEIYKEVGAIMIEYKRQNIDLNKKLQSVQDLGKSAIEAMQFINTFFNDLNDYVKFTNDNLITSTKKTIKNVFLTTIKEFEASNKKIIDEMNARDNAMLKYLQGTSKNIDKLNLAILDNNNILFKSYQKLGKDLEINAKAISQNTSEMISNINREGIKHLKNTTKLYFDDIAQTQKKILSDMSNQINKNQEMLDSALLELIGKYIESLEQISISSIEAQKEIYLSNVNNIKNLNDEIERYIKENALNLNQSNIELLNILKILQTHVESVLNKTTNAQEISDETIKNIDSKMKEISERFKGDYEWFLRRIREIIGQRM